MFPELAGVVENPAPVSQQWQGGVWQLRWPLSAQRSESPQRMPLVLGFAGERPLRVEGGDWSFVALPRADLRGVRLTGVRMREVDLTGADLTGGVLTNADLSGGQLAGARLTRCDLRGSDLSAVDPTAVQRTGAIIDPDQALVLARTMGFEIR